MGAEWNKEVMNDDFWNNTKYCNHEELVFRIGTNKWVEGWAENGK